MPTTIEQLIVPVSRAVRAGRCASQHFGAWSVEPKWFKTAMDSIRAGTWKPTPAADYDEDEDDGDGDDPGYTIQNGIAIICINGQMTKRGSSWGGCSTVEVRQAIRGAADDWMVNAVLLHVCTPGGTVAGTAELAADVRAVQSGDYNGRKKPVYAYAEDLCCSAGYWVASQCKTIWANVTAMVGCIGTYVVLEDDTGLQEQIGVKYRVVSTGEYKGLGADGAVSDKLVADVQREVDELNEPFLADVEAGRQGKISDVRTIADGRSHVGQQAKSLGLIDDVSSLDSAIAAIRKEIGNMPITSEQFSAHAAANPQASEVQALVRQGYEKGLAEAKPKPATIQDLEAAFPGRDGFILGQLKAGNTMAAASAAAVALVGAEQKEADKKRDEQLAAKDAEITELKQKLGQAEFKADGLKPLGTAGVPAPVAKGTPDSIAKIRDPKARAKAEWEAMDADAQANWKDDKAFIGFRAAELSEHATATAVGA